MTGLPGRAYRLSSRFSGGEHDLKGYKDTDASMHMNEELSKSCGICVGLRGVCDVT